MKRLDAILQDSPRAIKIDVEGHELFVLKGLGDYIKDTQLQFIICEMVHPEYFEPISDLLTSSGFAPYVYDVNQKKLMGAEIGTYDNIIWTREKI